MFRGRVGIKWRVFGSGMKDAGSAQKEGGVAMRERGSEAKRSQAMRYGKQVNKERKLRGRDMNGGGRLRHQEEDDDMIIKCSKY